VDPRLNGYLSVLAPIEFDLFPMTDENPVLLIVQQDQALAAVIAEIATQCGYETHLIENSKELAGKYREVRPTVILMELLMPDLDGIEMTKWLIEEQSRSRVLMTARRGPGLAKPAVMLAAISNLFTVTILPQPLSDENIRAALQSV
jgi:CheY-like chemotaxis protein